MISESNVKSIVELYSFGLQNIKCLLSPEVEHTSFLAWEHLFSARLILSQQNATYLLDVNFNKIEFTKYFISNYLTKIMKRKLKIHLSDFSKMTRIYVCK